MSNAPTQNGARLEQHVSNSETLELVEVGWAKKLFNGAIACCLNNGLITIAITIT